MSSKRGSPYRRGVYGGMGTVGVGGLVVLNNSHCTLPIIQTTGRLKVCAVATSCLPSGVTRGFSSRCIGMDVVSGRGALTMTETRGVSKVVSFTYSPNIIATTCITRRVSLPGINPCRSIYVLRGGKEFHRFLAGGKFAIPATGNCGGISSTLGSIRVFR